MLNQVPTCCSSVKRLTKSGISFLSTMNLWCVLTPQCNTWATGQQNTLGLSQGVQRFFTLQKSLGSAIGIYRSARQLWIKLHSWWQCLLNTLRQLLRWWQQMSLSMQQKLFGTGLNECRRVNLLSEIVSMICVADLKKWMNYDSHSNYLKIEVTLRSLKQIGMDQAANFHRLFWLIQYWSRGLYELAWTG